MKNLWKEYQQIPPYILRVITAEFFLQLINASFMLILLIYMDKSYIKDQAAGHLISHRFLGVILTSLPLGLYFRHHRILPSLKVSAILLPMISLAIVESIHHHFLSLLPYLLFGWGVVFSMFQVGILPFILRTSPPDKLTNSISLNYATYSVASIVAGILIAVMRNINPDFFDERVLLWMLITISTAACFFIVGVQYAEKTENETENDRNILYHAIDFNNIKEIRKILWALLPTLIIAVGAGLTIPFVSLFFYKIHHFDTESFAFIGSIASLLVAQMAFLVPYIKKKWGYRKAIPITQSTAVLALILMASTEHISNLPYMAMLASLLYIIRQPLMNVAAPMTSEVVMQYVGEKNREITSALTSAIWSGSWFFSAQIFSFLRSKDFHYSTIFYITAALYSIGVGLYIILVQQYEKNNHIHTLH